MKWTTKFTDIQRINNSHQYFVQVSADRGDSFSASAVLVFDLTQNDIFTRTEIPLIPCAWSSMVKDCAGNDLILAGAERMHHSWRNQTLYSHPMHIGWQSGNIWRASDDVAYYTGDHDEILAIRDGIDDIERLDVKAKLICINGLHPGFRVVAGQDGVLFINRGDGWRSVDDVPTLSNFVDIYCVNEKEIYLCAGYGGVFRWNGNSDWIRYDTAPDAFMYSLCQYKGRMCTASLHLKSYWVTGTAATPILESQVATRFKTDGELLFGLGLGKFEVFDGTNWRMYELDLYKLFPKELEAMYAAAQTP